jgi:DNA polymerase (family 10)
MAISNAAIADTLRRYAAVLSLEEADRFKLKAYRRAAQTIEALDQSVGDFIAEGGKLTDLPGIGKAISEIVLEIVQTGTLSRLEKTIAKLTPERAELATRPALDAEKVGRIYKKLGINSLTQMKQALDSGAIGQQLGSRMEFHVRRGLDDRPRHLLYTVEGVARSLQQFLESLPDVSRVSTTGSLRRKQDTVGDLNFLVASGYADAVFHEFTSSGAVQSAEPLSSDERRFTLSTGIVVSIRVVAESEWGLARLQATGSAAHLEDLESLAEAKRIKLSAASLRRARVKLSDEGAIYRRLGLAFIEPELREGRGEIAAAAERTLPTLVTVADLQGDLHMHTTASDGANTIAEMAAAAQERGYKYIAITDHSQSLKITNGLTEQRLRQHIKAIDKLNAKLSGFQILKSAEVDILEDGELDYSDAMLKELDFTICSIHSRFGRNKQQQTARIMRAMDNPYFTILGHATGRLLLKREGYELDIERIIAHAKDCGCFFEINSSPDRLDLSDEHAKMAKDAGIKIAVNTDAHSIDELSYINAGINQARRAWLEPADVLNVLPLAQLQEVFKR